MFTVRQTEQFVAWLDALKDKRAQIRIAARLYFVRRGRVIVVMLSAGDKSTQKRDIRHALKLASELGDDL